MRIIVITMGLFVLVNTATLAQLPSGDDIMNAWVSDKKIRVKPAMTFGWGAPQQWTAETSLYLGIFEKEGNPYIPNLINRTYKGICVTGAASYGGYKGTIKFFDFTAFNGPGGYQIGAAYYYNNENAITRSDTRLMGIELDVYALLAMRLGLLRDLHDNRYIPTAGLSIPIGPRMVN